MCLGLDFGCGHVFVRADWLVNAVKVVVCWWLGCFVGSGNAVCGLRGVAVIMLVGCFVSCWLIASSVLA